MSRASLVLIHGFGGRRESWSEVMDLVEAALPADAGIRMLPLALAGHEARNPTPGPESFWAEVDRLADQVRSRPRRRAHLVGYSMGGRLALGLLARHPTLWSGATLVGAHPGISDAEERRRRGTWDEGWAQRFETEPFQRVLVDWQDQALFSTQSPEQKARQLRMRTTLEPRGLAAALRCFGTASMPSLWSVLRDVAPSVRWVAGTLDSKFSALNEAAAARHPAGSAVSIAKTGHNVLIEAPKALAQILLEALGLQETEAASAPHTNELVIEGSSR